MNAVTMPAAESEVETLTSGLLAVIDRGVRDPNTDVEKMERLFALQERVLARAAEQAYAEAKHAAQGEMPQIKRTGKNSTTNSTYAELDEIADKTDPIAHKYGFSLTFGTADSPLEKHYRITGRLRHRLGFFEDYFADIPIDNVGMKGTQNKTATHGFGSTMTYGRRYLKILIWDIATTDDDGLAATSGALIDFKDLDLLKARCSQVGGDEARFAKALKVPSLPQLPAARVREAMAMLDARETANAIERQAK